VEIGDRTAIGLGANLIHGVTIGADTVVGAGALVVDDLAERVVAYGVPPNRGLARRALPHASLITRTAASRRRAVSLRSQSTV
jgi:serine acetyltransferase